MPRLSEGLILHVRQHEIHNMNLQRNWGGRTLAVKAEVRSHLWEWRSTDLLQSRQKGSAEAELPIFGNEGRVLVEKPIFRSLAAMIERKCRSETANLWKSRQRLNAEAELHIFGSPGRTSAESGTSDLCQSRQSGSAEAEHYIFGSQGIAEVRKRSFTYLAINAKQKCGRGTSDLCQSRQSGSGTSDLCQSRQSGSAEAEHQVFGSQGRAEVGSGISDI